MSYAEFGLDVTKKSKDDGSVGSWFCAWCDSTVSTGFGLCFSNWVICAGCVSEAVKNEGRWHDGADCFKCKKQGVRGYRNHESYAMDLYVCSDCVRWGAELTNGEILTEDIKSNIMERTCRKCGCTETRACKDSKGDTCYWVEDDLCSECLVSTDDITPKNPATASSCAGPRESIKTNQ